MDSSDITVKLNEQLRYINVNSLVKDNTDDMCILIAISTLELSHSKYG